ncbi:nucleoside deaminase [candidate division KSB1 bacterium]|nr:nucleoside deaminase [candidate division KSB1 bacterium]
MGTHESWMEQAFREAEKAFEKDEVPIGAVVVADGMVVGRGFNMVETLQDPTAHAEVIAITAAANSRNSWRLEDATLYVTKEPCPMCAGAIYLSRIQRVVFGASDSRMGACGSTLNIVQSPRLRSKVTVTCGILESKCLGILQAFFQKLRQNSSSER